MDLPDESFRRFGAIRFTGSTGVPTFRVHLIIPVTGSILKMDQSTKIVQTANSQNLTNFKKRSMQKVPT